jgi:hypothetical protein
MSEAFVSNEGLAALPEEGASSRFVFVSRRSGQVLLIVLSVLWIAEFLLLMFSLQGGADIVETDPASAQFLLLCLSLPTTLLLIISFVVFLVWIFRVHEDLGRLFPGYEISPHGALARVAIPFYNLYGIADVFLDISRTLVPGLKWWVVIFYGCYVVSFLLGLGGSEILPVFNQLTSAAMSSVWLIMTVMIYSALARRAQDESTG